jgi:D-alanyl-D-alanine carboxypeptidase (penicillin-binding protein 5/6)
VPALAAITAMPTAVVPVASVIRNTNTLLGQDGIVGLKSGQHAGRRRMPSHRGLEPGGRGKTLIVAATLGQPGTAGTIPRNALRAGHNLAAGALSLTRRRV